MTKELTDTQLERIDLLHNEIFDFINRILPNHKTISWDMGLIGQVAESLSTILSSKGICSEMDFYPYREDEEDVTPATEPANV